MEDKAGFYEDELSKEIVKDGRRLVLVASRMDDGQWELSVENEYGIWSVWHESFSTAQEAMDAGLLAIETEGMESFQSIEGFEYLLDDKL